MHALAGKTCTARREIIIYHLAYVTQQFFIYLFIFLCNEAIQRLASTRSVFVIVVIIEACFGSRSRREQVEFCPFLAQTKRNQAFPSSL